MTSSSWPAPPTEGTASRRSRARHIPASARSPASGPSSMIHGGSYDSPSPCPQTPCISVSGSPWWAANADRSNTSWHRRATSPKGRPGRSSSTPASTLSRTASSSRRCSVVGSSPTTHVRARSNR
nr:hypothetical protein [Nonomuraea phyllanthi]